MVRVSKFLQKKAKEFIPTGLKVKRLVEEGNLGPFKSVPEALDSACGAMDSCESHEILGGGILFQGEDGKWYTITLEAVVSEASKEFVKDTLDEKGIKCFSRGKRRQAVGEGRGAVACVSAGNRSSFLRHMV